jgi:hypothetical protein
MENRGHIWVEHVLSDQNHELGNADVGSVRLLDWMILRFRDA